MGGVGSVFDTHQTGFGITPKGRVTVRLLQLNRLERVEERQLLRAAKMMEILSISLE